MSGLKRRVSRLEALAPERPQASFVDLLIAVQPDIEPERKTAAKRRLEAADPDTPFLAFLRHLAGYRKAAQ